VARASARKPAHVFLAVGAASARPTEEGHDGQEWRHLMEAGAPASAVLAPELVDFDDH
jgi:hypothetical protein